MSFARTMKRRARSGTYRVPETVVRYNHRRRRALMGRLERYLLNVTLALGAGWCVFEVLFR